jgi:ribosomal protein L37E
MEKLICTQCNEENNSKAKYCSSCGYELSKIQTEEIKSANHQDTKSKSTNKKKLVQSLIIVVFVVISANLVPKLFSKTDLIDKEAMKTASEINKNCPIMIDAETRLDNTMAFPNNIFQYYYTLVKIGKDNADTLQLKNYIEPVLLNLVKTNPQMQYQRDHKWTLIYQYKDKTGLYLFSVNITPEMYSN